MLTYYFIIKELKISFKYNNEDYLITKELQKNIRYFTINSQDEYLDSDDENYLKQRTQEMAKYNYTRIIYINGNYVNSTLKNKYENQIKELILSNYLSFNYDNIIINFVEKNQITIEN